MGVLLTIMWVAALIGVLGFSVSLVTTYYMRTPKNFILLTIAVIGVVSFAFILKNFIAAEGWLTF